MPFINRYLLHQHQQIPEMLLFLTGVTGLGAGGLCVTLDVGRATGLPVVPASVTRVRCMLEFIGVSGRILFIIGGPLGPGPPGPIIIGGGPTRL